MDSSFTGKDSPLTARIKGSPEHIYSEDGAEFPLEILTKSLTGEITETPSNGSTPKSMLSERFLLKSPIGVERDDYLNDSPLHRVFTLDSPMASPDMEHNNFTPKFHIPLESKTFYSPSGTPDHGTRLSEKYSGSPSKDFNINFSPSVEHLENRSKVLPTASDNNGIKDSWMSSHTTPKGECILFSPFQVTRFRSGNLGYRLSKRVYNALCAL